MGHFKKRTLALVLASVVTVVGAFGANNYKNSLLGLNFELTNDGKVNMIVQTKMAYNGNVTPIKKDANTYVLMLPEVNSEAPNPDLTSVGNIDSVNIRTMPYSNNARGYTKITIKTSAPTITLLGKKQIFIPERKQEDTNKKIEKIEEIEPVAVEKNIEIPQDNSSNKTESKIQTEKYYNNEHYNETNNYNSSSENIEKFSDNEEEGIEPESYNTNPSDDLEENSYYLLWALIIILASVFFFIKAKNKMTEIAGEKFDIDINDNTDENSGKKKLEKIRKTIRTLDSAYSKATTLPIKTGYNNTVKKVKPAEEYNVVDLDELFKEQTAKTQEELDEENRALEEFLSGFSFDENLYEEELKGEEIEKYSFDEEYYQVVMKNKNISFSKNDISCINNLLKNELDSDLVQNITKYAVSNPIKSFDKEKFLEKIITEYAISQHIIFSEEDIKTLRKIINVEFDSSFVTDLRTNPDRTKKMYKDISEYGDKPKKPTEIITLKVHDMLPDLSEALKQQGNKEIESEQKAETVYFSEGYDFKKFAISEKLPDLTVEINKKESYISKPSAKYELTDTSYTVGNSAIKTDVVLPDLQDALKNPEKYTKKVERAEVDEQALLNNITNVQFKPFYDDSREIEIINDLESIPTVSDIKNELSQFEDFEINEDENIENTVYNNDNDDFAEFFTEDYVDLDKDNRTKNDKVTKKENNFVPRKLDRSLGVKKQERKNNSDKVFEKIKALKQFKNTSNKEKNETGKIEIASNTKEKNIQKNIEKCILEGSSYAVIDTINLVENCGCYLAKNGNKYTILSFYGDKLSKIKEYESLSSEKMQARLSEKLPDGTLRYIIRIGTKKFVVNMTNNSIEYVMDLC